MSTKFIFVTGGVLSGVGKGIVAASLGNLLKNRGYRVFLQKFDPYLNTDAGTLNPAEHGECFVTADGAETDLDLGHYERFLNEEMSRDSSVMSGSVYGAVIEKERQGKYLGKTVQVIPHVTNEVKQRLFQAASKSKAQILITEIGGTVGDIESTHFIEAARQVAMEQPENVIFVQVGYLPYLNASHEIKTKPIQNSIHDLESHGIHPSVIFCRADYPIYKEHLRKIALFAGLPEEAIIPLETADTVYAVPLMLAKSKVDSLILKKFGLRVKHRNGHDWQRLVSRIRHKRTKELNIALVGKYMSMSDTYFSVIEALKAASWQTLYKLNIQMVDSELIEQEGTDKLRGYDAICIPGGFGNRGIEGIISAIQFARVHRVPLLGLCLGMQLACVEYARNALGIKDANSAEFTQEGSHIIDIMPDQIKKIQSNHYGGSMRLGNFACQITSRTKTSGLYNRSNVLERHRHRYEFNNAYRAQFEGDSNFVISGLNQDLNLVEIIELGDHPFFIASQFHPEFKSRPNHPHPLFDGFIKATIAHNTHQDELIPLPFGRIRKVRAK